MNSSSTEDATASASTVIYSSACWSYALFSGQLYSEAAALSHWLGSGVKRMVRNGEDQKLKAEPKSEDLV